MSNDCILNGITFARRTDGRTDGREAGRTENAFQAQKLLFPAGSFPSRQPRSLSSVRPSVGPRGLFPSLLALARLSSLLFHASVRPSLPSPSVNRSSVRRLRFPPGRNLRACTQSVAPGPTGARAWVGAGEKSSVRSFFRGGRRIGGDGTAPLIRLLPP